MVLLGLYMTDMNWLQMMHVEIAKWLLSPPVSGHPSKPECVSEAGKNKIIFKVSKNKIIFTSSSQIIATVDSMLGVDERMLQKVTYKFDDFYQSCSIIELQIFLFTT